MLYKFRQPFLFCLRSEHKYKALNAQLKSIVIMRFTDPPRRLGFVDIKAH